MCVPDVMPGAEPFSATGGPTGTLVFHGFTGSPSSVRGLAEAYAAAGHTVSLPLLPGHGTTVEEMMDTSWADWTGAAEAAYLDLAGDCERVVVSGLSMGGSLTLWLATRHPEIAGLVCINPAVRPQPPAVLELIQSMLDAGDETTPGIGSDIAKDGVVEVAYDATPLRPLQSLMAGLEGLDAHLADVTSPLLLMTSPEDHVVDPADSDHLAATVAAPVERITLQRSYHVATQDHDAELIVEHALRFVREVAA
jgi:carboxylesterase